MNTEATILLNIARERTLTEEERQRLSYLLATENREEAAANISDTMEQTIGLETANTGFLQAMLQSIFESAPVQTAHVPLSKTVHRVHFLKTAWFRSQPSHVVLRWTKYAAAIIILFSGIAVYYNFFYISNLDNKVVQQVPALPSNDLPPGYNRAVLTLSNGQKIELDSAASETIKDGTLSIENNNGQLVYDGHRNPGENDYKNGDVVAMNTMATPKGGQYQLTLADGTKVWLNAASSITYPTAFTKNAREVSITGEAYFEVSPGAKKPFIVKANTHEITVLGTSFNVNSYADEYPGKTSLLTGKIKINGQVLLPGQAYTNGKIIATNLEQDIAWRNGIFNFDRVTLREAMRQLSRWYDVEVQYPASLADKKFGGEMSRSLTLSQVLKLLNGVGMHFRLEGKTIIVTP